MADAGTRRASRAAMWESVPDLLCLLEAGLLRDEASRAEAESLARERGPGAERLLARWDVLDAVRLSEGRAPLTAARFLDTSLLVAARAGDRSAARLYLGWGATAREFVLADARLRGDEPMAQFIEDCGRPCLWSGEPHRL